MKTGTLKKIGSLLLISAVLVTLAGCATAKTMNKPKEKEKAISVTDMEGRTTTFDTVPDKIAVLLASDVEILYKLDAQDRIIAVGESCNYPKEALKKKVISTGKNLNIEQIIALAPKAVVMGKMGQTKEQIQQLEDAGIKVLVTNSQNIEDTYVAIKMLGKLTGKEKQAAHLIKYMKDSFAQIRKKENKGSEKTVYFEVSPLEYGLWTAGKGTFMQELADIVGVKNAFGDVAGWAKISEEQVIDRNPDYIITSTMYDGKGKKPVDEILGRPSWEKITAVKNKKVFQGDSDMMTRPGPRLVDAAAALYDFVYGK
jgi:iron complex transport system substrate-binding protein